MKSGEIVQLKVYFSMLTSIYNERENLGYIPWCFGIFFFFPLNTNQPKPSNIDLKELKA